MLIWRRLLLDPVKHAIHSVHNLPPTRFPNPKTRPTYNSTAQPAPRSPTPTHTPTPPPVRLRPPAPRTSVRRPLQRPQPPMPAAPTPRSAGRRHKISFGTG